MLLIMVLEIYYTLSGSFIYIYVYIYNKIIYII